jgi:hypothetical protein
MLQVEMTGFAYEIDGLTTVECWSIVNRNPRPADSLLTARAKQVEQINWAKEQLTAARIVDRCYIALSCVGNLPWLELRLPHGLEGLATYWSGLLIRSALIWNGEQVILDLHSGERGFSARFYPRALFNGV